MERFRGVWSIVTVVCVSVFVSGLIVQFTEAACETNKCKNILVYYSCGEKVGKVLFWDDCIPCAFGGNCIDPWDGGECTKILELLQKIAPLNVALVCNCGDLAEANSLGNEGQYVPTDTSVWQCKKGG